MAMMSEVLIVVLTLSIPDDTPPRIEEARRLLAKAGYPGGKGFPKVTLLYNTLESHKKIAASVTETWRKTLGIEVAIRNVEWKVYLDRLSKREYDIARRGWIGDHPDPATFLDIMRGE